MQNSMFIIDKKISLIQAQSLKNFLDTAKDTPSMVIYNLSLINCEIDDDKLARILEGILAQGNKLASFIFSKNELGEKSLKLIC